MKLTKQSGNCALALALSVAIVNTAVAQEEPVSRCEDRGCEAPWRPLFNMRALSEIEMSADTTLHAIADDAQRHAINLPNSGLIWLTEDPDIGQPSLAVSAPSYVGFDGQKVTKPLQFYVRSNYSAFVDRYELTIYRGEDTDLIEPLVQLPIAVSAVAQVEWDGRLPDRYRYRAGDTLVYVLRAYSEDGSFDETFPQQIQMVRPEEAEKGILSLRDDMSKNLGTALSNDEAQSQSLIDQVFSENGLRQQNISIFGSRVRIQGRNVPQGGVRINGEQYPVDLERKFTAEFLMPPGQHDFALDIAGITEGNVLSIDVTGNYFFGVGIADITAYQNKTTGSGSELAQGARDKSVLTDARLAFYMKAKARARYLVTLQADTTERDIEKLFSGFTQADPQDVFRTLDPDLYYPTYGDDSSIYRDVDTMGRFYLRVDWDKNQALWGNFNTGFTGTEFAQYSRSLYGAALSWRSYRSTRWGNPGSELRMFGSQAESAPGHTELIGTGGSLYYLRHANILPGSDKIVLEVRDRTTGRTEVRVDLTRGSDYEIDSIQGRIILTRPLMQLTRENMPTITRDVPWDGLEQRLLVDYEWVPSGFDDDEITYGVRGRHWFGDHVALGVTYVNENRSGDDYSIKGADITLQAGKGTYLKMEYAETESSSAPIFFSDNGGFTFTQINSTGSRSGNAKSIEARANFRELGWMRQELSAGAWWRDVSDGYSTSRSDFGRALTEYGAEVLGRFTNHLGVYARYSRSERGDDRYTQAQVTGEWRIRDAIALSAEVRRVETESAAEKNAGILGAIRYNHRVASRLELYGIGQVTLSDDHGTYESNDSLTVGGKYLYGNLSSVGMEYTTGDRGDSYQINAEHRINPNHSFYGSYTFSESASDYDSVFNVDRNRGWTVGQRWRISDQVNLYNETQFLKAPAESGLANTLGMDFYLGVGWTINTTLQNGDLDTVDGTVRRKAASVGGGRTSQTMEWQSRLEWRRDSGAQRREQWVSTNRLSIKLNESWRLAGRFNYSDTDDKLSSLNGARFIEGNIGFAYRPWNTTRWAAFGRYTYLYDLSTSGQVNGVDYDQRSQIVSLEGVYKPLPFWEFAVKAARREGEVRYGRGSGRWFDSATTLLAGQVRYDVFRLWHALAEYRWLDVKDGGTRQGWMVGLDRDINAYVRVGVGYNFTDFSDDLTKYDYTYRGWFINLVGRY